MFNLKKGLFQKAVNPLNFADDQAYIASFHRSAPRRVGIAIDLTWKEVYSSPISERQQITTTLAGLAMQLMENPTFRQKYFPPEVEDFQVQCMGGTVLAKFWDPFPNIASEWTVDGIALMVSFYDAGDNAEAPMVQGFGAAMIALQECIAKSGSVDPTTHSRLRLSRADALDHDKAIGSLYEDGMGIWCEPLLPLWNALMNKFRAYLTTIPDGGLLAVMDIAGKKAPKDPE